MERVHINVNVDIQNKLDIANLKKVETVSELSKDLFKEIFLIYWWYPMFVNLKIHVPLTSFKFLSYHLLIILHFFY